MADQQTGGKTCPAHGIPAHPVGDKLAHDATGAICIGPDVMRDARVDAYRDRERRRAARALDRYFASMHSDSDGDPFVAGERFVEQVGDYVLARLGERAAAAGGDVHADWMAHLYDCCSAAPTEPHTADCPRNGE